MGWRGVGPPRTSARLKPGSQLVVLGPQRRDELPGASAVGLHPQLLPLAEREEGVGRVGEEFDQALEQGAALGAVALHLSHALGEHLRGSRARVSEAVWLYH